LIDVLKEASEGLLFMSESDYPWEVFHWKSDPQQDIIPEFILERTGYALDTPVEVVDFDSFFAIATTEQNWHNQDDRETVKRYQNLVKILKDNLTQIQVIRVGTINIDVYIVGKTANGELAGIATKVVET
jgi:Nuclease A inhibitor-like protein